MTDRRGPTGAADQAGDDSEPAENKNKNKTEGEEIKKQQQENKHFNVDFEPSADAGGVELMG